MGLSRGLLVVLSLSCVIDFVVRSQNDLGIIFCLDRQPLGCSENSQGANLVQAEEAEVQG